MKKKYTPFLYKCEKKNNFFWQHFSCLLASKFMCCGKLKIEMKVISCLVRTCIFYFNFLKLCSPQSTSKARQNNFFLWQHQYETFYPFFVVSQVHMLLFGVFEEKSPANNMLQKKGECFRKSFFYFPHLF